MNMSFTLNSKYSNVCRTCLVENASMTSIFIKDELVAQAVPLCEILMSFTSIEMLKADGLPEQVCASCAQEINRVFSFRKLCEKSDVTLRNCIRSLLPLPTSNNHLNTALKSEEKHKCNEFTDTSDIQHICVIVKNESSDKHDKTVNVEQFLDNVFEDDDEQNKDEDMCKSELEDQKNSDVPRKYCKKKVHPCKECHMLCLGSNEYKKHMREKHGLIFKCDICKKELRSATTLNRHLHLHNINPEGKQNALKTGITKKRNMPRTCGICNKTFRFHSNLERHKLIHTGEKPYLCNVCGKGFAQLSYLKIHSFIHTGEKPYKCKMCEKSFAAPGTLMTHIRTHTGERPHVCKICGKDFPQSGYLTAHIRTHTGEKPIECKVCHRRFNQSGRLIIHMRIHSGEKPYSCVECGRCFAVKGTLKKHIRTHTGERPYVCNVCGQAFAQSGTLATHMKIHRSK